MGQEEEDASPWGLFTSWSVYDRVVGRCSSFQGKALELGSGTLTSTC